ncbi:MAG: hypothetical protein KC910_27420, partial [Candidatus Eremiobacteraeota bacterium]|nr:hypothetical protein [Candidatus Eremiobacteraeota bacterium]
MKVLTISRTAEQLAPLVPLTRYLYYHRLCDGMSLIQTTAEWQLDDNPFVIRYYREFSPQLPAQPDEEWFARATRRALLEERPDWVILGERDQQLERFCQQEGIGVLEPGQVSPPESAWLRLEATPALPVERPSHDPLEVLGDFTPPA